MVLKRILTTAPPARSPRSLWGRVLGVSPFCILFFHKPLLTLEFPTLAPVRWKKRNVSICIGRGENHGRPASLPRHSINNTPQLNSINIYYICILVCVHHSPTPLIMFFVFLHQSPRGTHFNQWQRLSGLTHGAVFGKIPLPHYCKRCDLVDLTIVATVPRQPL